MHIVLYLNLMNKPFFILNLIIAFFVLSVSSIDAQVDNYSEEYYRAEVLETRIVEAVNLEEAEPQTVSVRLQNGSRKGEEIEAQFTGFAQGEELRAGETIVVVMSSTLAGENFFVTDRYRINSLAIILGLFFFTAVLFAGIKGASSLLGLVFSILILALFIVPQIAQGSNPVFVSLFGAFVIAIVSLYVAHGFSKRTSIALAATLITLVIATGLSFLFVYMSNLTGYGTEEAAFLQFGPFESINMRGLLLGGIIIGVLGVLDDITTSQVAAVDEIRKANPKLKIKSLYNRGVSVGTEHIASLVNTLVLAYAGASMPLFLLFSINQNLPFWVTINSEFIAEEIVRTLVGSSALIFAVPISTYLAAYFLSKK